MRLFRILLAAAILAASAPAAHAQDEAGQTFSARVIEVDDGGTFDVRRSTGGEVTVRLRGVDAPESAQPYGTQATRRARAYIGGKNVRVSVEDVGRYGRAIARVNVQGGDLGAMLIRDGMAWWHEQYAPGKTEYQRLQRQARNANRGL